MQSPMHFVARYALAGAICSHLAIAIHTILTCVENTRPILHLLHDRTLDEYDPGRSEPLVGGTGATFT